MHYEHNSMLINESHATNIDWSSLIDAIVALVKNIEHRKGSKLLGNNNAGYSDIKDYFEE